MRKKKGLQEFEGYNPKNLSGVECPQCYAELYQDKEDKSHYYCSTCGYLSWEIEKFKEGITKLQGKKYSY
jgi:Zn ribbon nucleic-acid-binding protein